MHILPPFKGDNKPRIHCRGGWQGPENTEAAIYFGDRGVGRLGESSRFLGSSLERSPYLGLARYSQLKGRDARPLEQREERRGGGNEPGTVCTSSFPCRYLELAAEKDPIRGQLFLVLSL